MTADQGSALRIEGLRKTFGKQTVLDYLDWSLPTGRVIGLLGRNGAGKSTLIRCALGLSPIDAGSVALFGEPVARLPAATLHRIGYVPQSFDLFPWMKVRQYLNFHAAFYARWNGEMVDGLLGRWEVDAAKKIGELSQGQRQKLAIIRAIAPDPDLFCSTSRWPVSIRRRAGCFWKNCSGSRGGRARPWCSRPTSPPIWNAPMPRSRC